MLKLIKRKIRSKRVWSRLNLIAKELITLGLILISLAVLAPRNKTESTAQATPEVSTPVIATESISAHITFGQTDGRALKLQAYLESKSSPLASYAVDFIAAADQYGLDYRLLPAISGVESTFGKNYLSGTYNGWGWGGGYISFPSWTEGIYQVAKGLHDGYTSRGLSTPAAIATVYDPRSFSWATNVQLYINQIENFK